MRKVAIAAAVSLVLLSACSNSSDSSKLLDSEVGSADSSPNGESTVPPATDAPVPTPSVKIPSVLPTSLVVTPLKPGTGDKAANGDTVIVRYVGVRSKDGKEFDSNYDGEPFSVELGSGSVIKGWDQGLVNSQAGGQLQLDIPSDLAYGAQSQGDIIGPNEALTFVIDVLAVIHPVDPASEPVLVIKPAKVEKVITEELVDGTGPGAVEGQTIIFHYIFYRGDTGAKLYSSWSGAPATIQLTKGVGGDSSVDALIEGLVGTKVGGRRQISVPGASAFGGKGDSGLGLPAGTDVVLVADLLAVY